MVKKYIIKSFKNLIILIKSTMLYYSDKYKNCLIILKYRIKGLTRSLKILLKGISSL
jgi:hypothetical protein